MVSRLHHRRHGRCSALLAVDPDTDAVARGVDWLVRTQRRDGGWDEDLYTGTGFPGDFYINYEMYRVVFPLSALGRYLAAGKDVIDLTDGAGSVDVTDGAAGRRRRHRRSRFGDVTDVHASVDLTNVPEQRAATDEPAGKAGAS